MKRDTLVYEEGRAIFKCRGDIEPKGLAFWVRMRLRDDLSSEESNQVKHSLDGWLQLRDLGSEGGEFGAWHWQQLVSARELRDTATQEDVDALKKWVGQQPHVVEWEVGDLADIRELEPELGEGFSEVMRDTFHRAVGGGN